MKGFQNFMTLDRSVWSCCILPEILHAYITEHLATPESFSNWLIHPMKQRWWSNFVDIVSKL